MKQFFLGILLSVLLLSGCGYKPTTHYAREILGQKIYAEVIISRKDPRNSVLIKDAVNEAIVSRFGAKITSQEEADTVLNVSIEAVNFSPTVYDQYGYVIAYKAIVSLVIFYENKNGKKVKTTTMGEYDFSIEANSVISDSSRFNAIKYASLDAIDEFISKIAIKGLQNGNNN
ncbi:MAG: LPS assembly lipoprotein LptE [Sulfurospirillaceae bacterium]|nr:LPS assembly lipoprotein LptE [Sulfurospirillaceae bacterium]